MDEIVSKINQCEAPQGLFADHSAGAGNDARQSANYKDEVMLFGDAVIENPAENGEPDRSCLENLVDD